MKIVLHAMEPATLTESSSLGGLWYLWNARCKPSPEPALDGIPSSIPLKPGARESNQDVPTKIRILPQIPKMAKKTENGG